MISVDNAVELAIKTYLGLTPRARGTAGPSRRELEAASESFPELLNLLQVHAADKIVGLSLDDIEWYHRLRNQLYHSGNGITVEIAKVETYLQLALSLFENLFGFAPSIERKRSNMHTEVGEFLALWNHFEMLLRSRLPPKEGPAYYWKLNHLASIDPEAAEMWEPLAKFRNELVHGLGSVDAGSIAQQSSRLKKLIRLLDNNA